MWALAKQGDGGILPEDEDYLLECEPMVVHYQVVRAA